MASLPETLPAPRSVAVRDLRKVFRSAARWRQIVRGQLRGPEVVALAGIDLEVAPGEVMGVMGPNGAGKSTLLRILAGLVLPTAGEAVTCGSVAFVVADERSFSWRLTGRHNLEFFANLYGYRGADADARVAAALERVALTGEADRPYREYSTGMRQRMALARGLLAEADIFLLDEPTRGVDPEAARLLRRFIRAELVERQRRTVLLATHDLYDVRELATRVAILRGGRIDRVTAPEHAPQLFAPEDASL
jgi:ABC-2 type transport system ATP-binding protein